MIRAIDVSRWQGAINWHAVAGDGVQAAWVKVGGADGGLYRDSQGWTNIRGCESAGIPYGTYYFCNAAADPKIQARHAVEQGHGRGALWPVADLEVRPPGFTHEQMDRWLDAFCAEVRRLTGRESIWYGGIGTGVGYTDFAPKRCGCWIANYGTNRASTTPPNFQPRVPPAWPDWDIWQFNSTTRVAGISANTVDQNVIKRPFWDRMAGGPLSEEYGMKGVQCPDHTGDVVWDVTADGNGHRRRRGIADPDELEMMTDVGVIDGVIELKGAKADRFLERFPEANPATSDVGALMLAMNVMALVREHAGELRELISTALDRPVPDVDERSLAEYLLTGSPDAPALPAALVGAVMEEVNAWVNRPPGSPGDS